MYLSLDKIIVNDTDVTYEFSYSEGLAKYFSNIPFTVTYPVSISEVPESVLAVPFVCNVLPLIWLTDSVLKVKDIDEDFFCSIPKIKNGYIKMFPEASFGGKIEYSETVKCKVDCHDKCGVFFSGGLDAVYTLTRHISESPMLISIWGSDVLLNNVNGWESVCSNIKMYSEHFGFPLAVIKTSFRAFDDEKRLCEDFECVLKDSWWHGVKHGIGLLGHSAPLAYLNGWSKVYIASSNCSEDTNVRCASHPSIDNNVAFCSCRVIHDGYESNRQKKVTEVVEYAMVNNEQLSLHVCWESDSGKNCCQCEKCYRTIAGILAEGADPKVFGFNAWKETVTLMKKRLIDYGQLSSYTAANHWVHIKRRLSENYPTIRKKPYYKHIKWILKKGLITENGIRLPVIVKLKRSIGKYKLFWVLKDIKDILLGKKICGREK